MPELSRINPVSKTEEKLLFCHIPRTGGESILKALKDSGWSVDFNVWGQELKHPTYWHLHAHYKTAKRRFPRAFAVCRHPMRRLESAFYHNNRATGPLDMWAQIAQLTTEKMYTVFDRHIRPASDLIVDDATVYRYEAGFAEIFKKLKFRGVVGRTVKIDHLGANSRPPVDWQKAPQHIIEKIVQVYAQDYYNFEYELFPED